MLYFQGSFLWKKVFFENFTICTNIIISVEASNVLKCSSYWGKTFKITSMLLQPNTYLPTYCLNSRRWIGNIHVESLKIVARVGQIKVPGLSVFTPTKWINHTSISSILRGWGTLLLLSPSLDTLIILLRQKEHLNSLQLCIGLLQLVIPPLLHWI
jgi:hypothetical protein